MNIYFEASGLGGLWALGAPIITIIMPLQAMPEKRSIIAGLAPSH